MTPWALACAVTAFVAILCGVLIGGSYAERMDSVARRADIRYRGESESGSSRYS